MKDKFIFYINGEKLEPSIYDETDSDIDVQYHYAPMDISLNILDKYTNIRIKYKRVSVSEFI